ncbi:N-acetylmuramoyl-L-alanine amidase family protein [Pelosinus fermentans]|uniref:Cell wall hydrolase/autolysin n=1 Tax=Pelosinus fermentans JBW45 TaxID=1192197 RepID=I9NL21_9FIRM|nr:N-acetylmuramoyl-L-alanine amidase [Pelosinus fermentans]AJQ29001.1 cell wall hydrolase/autolysin [Pelosinus fermentans JBW45]
MAKILINPGHAPGIDPGAVNQRTQLQEADVVRTIGQHVSDLLGQVGYATCVVQNDSLSYICDQANQWGADLFISIHCNSAANLMARGTETYYMDRSVQGCKLASCIQQQLVDASGFIDRGIKTANFYVLKNTDAPAALVEIAFISNDEEAGCLGDAALQYEYARAIARGISDYWR